MKYRNICQNGKFLVYAGVRESRKSGLVGKCYVKIRSFIQKLLFGISFIGIVAFVIQEIPYIIMPFIKPASNPIMNMQNEIKWIETVQSVFGILSMILLMLLVRDDVKFFSIETTRESILYFNVSYDID